MCFVSVSGLVLCVCERILAVKWEVCYVLVCVFIERK